MRKNLTQQHILIYDDALSFIILKLLKNNSSAQNYSSKDKDTMPQIYATSVYKLVSRYANTHNIYAISPLLKDTLNVILTSTMQWSGLQWSS